MHQPLDFYAQNIYNGNAVAVPKKGKPEFVLRRSEHLKRRFNGRLLRNVCIGALNFYMSVMENQLYTENGLSCHDAVSLDGKVHDPNRIDFLARYLHYLKQAVEDGVNVKGYFQWSLMDNFEWAKGYSDRFGLIYVDYQTQQRIWKDSAYWYRDMIKENGKNL